MEKNMKSRVSRMAMYAALGLFSGSGALGAQQPIVARAAAHPSLRLVMQVDPGQPDPPQANSSIPKDDLFAGTEKFAKNASDVNEISMDPETLGMVGGADAKRARHLLLSVVRSYTYDKPGMYNPADVEEYRRKLETGGWHCSVHTRDLKTGESTDICSRHPSADVIENAIITVAPKELTFIHTIKKNNGEGGMNLGMGMDLMGLSPEFSMAFLGPQMKAEILASTAVMRAEMPALMGSLGDLRMNMPRLDSEEMQRSLKEAERTMKDFGGGKLPALRGSPSSRMFLAVPTPPEPPEALEAPDAPGAPDAPPAPEAPPTPLPPSAAPAAPAAPGPPAPSPAPKPPSAPQ